MESLSEDAIFIKNLGQHIVALRKEKKIKQIDLAIAMDMEDAALRRIESGKTNPTVKTLLRIAKGLDTDILTLLNF